MKNFDAPRTRSEFERNFQLLHKRMKDGKMHFVQGVSFDGLLRVRYLPNGRIDFLSVDEMARLHANTMSQFDGGALQEKIQEIESVEKKDVADGKKVKT